MATTTKWTTKDDQRYGELYRLIIAADSLAELFEECCEFDTLRSKAISCGMDVDPLPF